MPYEVDRLIREAIERGEFDDLQGEGQPIVFEERPHEDPAYAAAFRMLKSQGYSLPWISLGNQIDLALEEAKRSIEQRLAWLQQQGLHPGESHGWRRAEDGFRARVHKINEQLKHYNLTVPLARFQRPLIDAEAIIYRLLNSTPADG